MKDDVGRLTRLQCHRATEDGMFLCFHCDGIGAALGSMKDMRHIHVTRMHQKQSEETGKDPTISQSSPPKAQTTVCPI